MSGGGGRAVVATEVDVVVVVKRNKTTKIISYLADNCIRIMTCLTPFLSSFQSGLPSVIT